MLKGSVLYVSTTFEGGVLFIQKLFAGPKISKLRHLGHETTDPPCVRSFYGPHAGGVLPPSLHQKLYVQTLLTGSHNLEIGHVTTATPT